MEISNLKAQNETLQERFSMFEPKGDSAAVGESKSECRCHLEKMLERTLSYEQKLIKQQYENEQQEKQLNDLENLLRNKDDLIAVMKAKKDELIVENESLKQFASDIREALLQVSVLFIAYTYSVLLFFAMSEVVTCSIFRARLYLRCIPSIITR